MKPHLLALLVLLISCNSPEAPEISIDSKHLERKIQEPKKIPANVFRLYYSYAGLGSNFGSMEPDFEVIGRHYRYYLKQNTFYSDRAQKKPEFVCQGKLRSSSIDSILDLVKEIKDTLISKTDPGIMSGGIQSILIKKDTINVRFSLHNVSDPRAEKIVQILNSNIPADKQKL